MGTHALLQRVLMVVLVGYLAPASAATDAFCLPEIAYYRYVGDKASDTQCTDNDIQSAINNMVCPNTTIVITGEHTYTAQHLEINGKDLTLAGTSLGCGPPGACDGGCPLPPTSPVIVISGSGHSGDSVLYIHGTSHVTLRYLDIRDGNNFNGGNPTYGGGIHFDGIGSLTLDTTWIRSNQAMYGGGINFTGSGGFAGLALLGHTQIANNSAGASGGGIRIDGQSFLSIAEDNSIVWLNHAPNGYGGGINIVGPAHADIASPGYASFAVVASNDAQYGGGIAVTGGDDGDEDGALQLFTTDPARPVRVRGNFASSSGGGIYLKTLVSFANGIRHASLCAFDFGISDNAAPEGSAIYAAGESDLFGTDFGSLVLLNYTPNSCTALPAYARRCTTGPDCNTISGNAAVDGANTPTSGAAIFTSNDSDLAAERVALRANTGGYAVRVNGGAGKLLSNCLLADNQVTQQLVRFEGGTAEIGNCTLAGNSIQSTDTIHAEGQLTLRNSIIAQPGNLALAFSGLDLSVQYLLTNDKTSLPAGEGIVVGAPTFVDAANGDYHLQANSLGLDFAPHVTGNTYDLDRLLRDRDLPGVPNYYGALDLGAYERQPACSNPDTLFCDGFELQ
jgi:hypothetical protein